MKEEILFHQFASIAMITYINTPTVLSFFKTDARRRSNAHPGNQKKVKRKKKQAQAIDREDQLKFGLVWFGALLFGWWTIDQPKVLFNLNHWQRCKASALLLVTVDESHQEQRKIFERVIHKFGLDSLRCNCKA